MAVVSNVDVGGYGPTSVVDPKATFTDPESGYPGRRFDISHETPRPAASMLA
jgi:hypothetical protein